MAGCQKCGGTGRYGTCEECEGNKQLDCSTCKGAGELNGAKCTSCHDGKVDCMDCVHPTTHEPTGQAPCNKCDGTGVLTYEA